MTQLALALPFDFAKPQWLWLCLLVPVLILISLRSLAGLEPTRRFLAIAARCLLIVLVAACLAEVEYVRRNDDLTVMFLMDRSHSVEELQDQQETFIREASETMPPDDRLGMIDFARTAYVEQLPRPGGFIIPPGRLPTMPNIDRTNIASAIKLAMAMFPHDTAKRIVLMSDGNDNMGDVITQAREAKANGIPIDVRPLWYEHRNEIYFDRMIAATHAEPGEQLPLRMVISSQRAASGTLAIYQNGKPVPLSEEASRVTLAPGNNTLMLRLPVNTSGSHSFEAVFRPDDESMDGVALNNSARAFTFVSGGSRVLLISGDALHDQALLDALVSEKVNVDLIEAANIGEFGLLQMMNYSSIILSNVPAASFTEQQLSEFAVYVKDMGSGLIMAGGPESFGAGGWIGTPVEEVMPVSFEIKHKRVIPRGALALIMHSCEIPRGNYWGKEMAKKSVDTISSQDYIGVLAYTWSPGGTNWEVPLGLNNNKQAVKNKIDRMAIGDMPDFAQSMEMAHKELTRGRGSDAAQRHVIILSDGDAAPPSPQLIANYKRDKVTVSTIAIGWGAHVMTTTLQDIARKTGGKFYSAKNPRQLPQIFVKESKVVRRPLIVDEAFQPQVYHADSVLLDRDAAAAGFPPLGGMILSSPKESPNVLMPLIRATDDGNDPVLAHWQYELGKTVAFTSGYWPIWGEDWTAWPRFAKFWAQLVRWTMRQESPANFETRTQVEGGRGRITIDALDKDASYLNFLNFQSRVIGPDNKSIPITFTQTGPGHYEADFDAEQAGQYLANVQVFESGSPRGVIRTGLSIPFSPEYRDLVPNEGLLRQIVEITGGRWLDAGAQEAEVFSHDLPPTEARKPGWEWVLAWLLLPLFLLDVAVRRLANWLALSIAVELVVLVVLLFGLKLYESTWWGILGAILLVELIGWTMRFRYIGPLFDFMTHSATALAGAGERSESSLGQLKSTRDRVRGDMQGEEEQKGRKVGPDIGSIPVSTAKRRFDVGDERAEEKAGDLTDAVGGAKVSDSKPGEGDKPAAPTQGEDDVSATERLLRAKRRARKNKNDDQP